MTAIMSVVRADLRRILFAVPGLPAVVKLEGQVFEPEAGVPYIAERLDPVATDTLTIGNRGGGMAEERMIYAIEVWQPAEEPAGEDTPDALTLASDMADAIRAAFWHGCAVGGPAYSGLVLTSELAPLLESPGWLHIPVRVTFLVRRPVLVA